MSRIVIDLDNTITIDGSATAYSDKLPNLELVARLRQYRDQGFEIVIFSSRNMRTFDGQIGKINVHTLPAIIDWLKHHDVPYDEVIVGKPWCGHGGFYVDDKAIRPQEFLDMSLAEIRSLVGLEAPGDDPA